MSAYTLTIQPDDGTAPTTTVRVDYTTQGPRITGLHIDTETDGGLTPHALPVIDLATLIRALAPVAHPGPAITTATQPGAPAAPALAPVAAASPPASSNAAASGRSPRRAAHTARSSRPKAKETKPDARSGTRTATSRARTDGGNAAAGASAANGRRPYRRAPEDLASVFRQVGNVAGVADYYQVPRHTAQAWVNSARGRGQIATP